METQYSIILGDHRALLEANNVLLDKEILPITNIIEFYEVTQIVI